jgi:hypothetical protein
MKNSNDTIGNRTRDLPACSAVPQPTAPARAPVGKVISLKYHVCQTGSYEKRYCTLLSIHLAVDFRYSCHQMSAFQILLQTTNTEVTRYK